MADLLYGDERETTRSYGYSIVPVSVRPSRHWIASKWFWRGFARIGGTDPLVAVHSHVFWYSGERSCVSRWPASVRHLVSSTDTFLIKGYLVIIYMLNLLKELVSLDISGKVSMEACAASGPSLNWLGALHRWKDSYWCVMRSTIKPRALKLQNTGSVRPQEGTFVVWLLLDAIGLFLRPRTEKDNPRAG